MSRTIDERVVEMRFDNQQFERNAQTSISTLTKLKQSLKLESASKGLENVSAAAKNCNLSGLTGAIETVHAKFSAFEIMSITALANITNSAVNAGKRIISALTIEPIKTGFQEYETQINAIQTILANTESKGSTLQDVNTALDELNHYADMTIYNFTEMTRNIGTFTAAGVDLDTSVSAIKGIANLAAVSGSTSQQASTAMYQLSQALASGTVKLMDWNSVVNAGMGGQVFQDALKETARVHGIAIDNMIKEEGSFRETLQKGWLSSEILTETLSKFTGDLSEAQLKSMGYSEEQVKSIVKMGQTANDAATKVKTLSQLWDTLKEAAQSGWTKTWQLVVGDFGEAKELYTSISDTVSEFLNKSSDRRNDLLEGALLSNWGKLTKAIGEAGIETSKFEDKVKETAIAHGYNVEGLISKYGSLGNAFRDGALSTMVLRDAVTQLNGKLVDLSGVQRILQSSDTGDDVKKIQEALQSLDFDIGGSGVDGILGSATESAIKAFQEANKLEVTGMVDEVTLAALQEACKSTDTLGENIFGLIDGVTELGGREKLIESFKNVFKALSDIIAPVKEAFGEVFPPTTVEQLTNAIDKIHEFTGKLKVSEETANKIKRTFSGVFSVFDLFKKAITAIISPIGKFIGSGGLNGIVDALLSVTASIGDFFTSINDSTGVGDFFSSFTDGVFNLLREIISVIDPALGKVESVGDVFVSVGNVISNAAKNIFTVLGDLFGWITDNISAGDIFAGLAGGGIFALTKKASKLIESVKDGIDGIFNKGSSAASTRFSDILEGVKETLTSFTSGIKVASLFGIAAAIAILSVALNSIAKVEGDDVIKSLSTIGVMLGLLSGSLFLITKVLSTNGSKGLIKAGASLILIAEAVKIFADAMVKVSDLSWEEIAKGLTAMGVSLLAFSAALKIINRTKISLRTSLGMLALAEACKILGDALGKFSNLSWGEIGRGLTAMGGALAEFTIALSVISKAGGFGALLGGTGILVAVQSLDEISENLKRLGGLSWEEIRKGLAAMGGALGEFTIALGVLSKIGGFGAVLGALGVLIATKSLDDISTNLKKLGELSWEEIGKGLAAMGGALGELTVSLGVLSKIGGFGALLGSVGILVAVQALSPIATALTNISSLTWGEIGKGLVGMGAALGEVSAISGVLGRLAGFSGLLGGGSILLGVQGLGDLANALKRFGGMTWGEIGKGLVGMGGALTEVGTISGLLGNLGGLGALVGSGSILIGVQGLGDLASALQQFGTMDWDEIGRGLAAMGGALGETAVGGLINTLSGFGAISIATVAGPLGTLAESVQKWADVSVPDGLGLQLATLAGGIKAYNFSGFGANAISKLAEPLGDLADSIVKWTGVTVPDGIDTQLGNLAAGIKQFNFTGWGASSVKEMAAPLGDLADSVVKWSDLTIPDNMETVLGGLARGVQAWNILDYNFIPSVTSNIEGFADEISKWNGVTISDSLPTNLQGLAEGVSACNDISTDSLTNICTGISDIGTAVTGISNIDFEGVSAKLSTFASSISTLNVSTDGFTSMGGSIVDKFTSAISDRSSSLSSVGTSLIDGLTSGMEQSNSVSSTISSIISSASGSAKDSQKDFISLGSYMVSGFVSGMRAKLSDSNAIGQSLATAGISGARKESDNFYSAGAYAGSGFINGMRSRLQAAAQAGAEIARAAKNATTSTLDEHSPSKVFYKIGDFAGLGFVNGLISYRDASSKAGASVATSAREGLTKAISKATDIVQNGVSDSLTIRPVLDLSAVEAGAGRINGIIGARQSIPVSGNIRAISMMMNDRQTTNNNDDVVSAIGKLQKSLGNRSGDSYVINGITYDDSSNVADAMRAIVREARRERRG